MNSEIKAFLNQYLNTLTESDRKKYDHFDSYHFCNEEKDANTLADLTLKGEKRATAGLLWGYEYDNDPIPEKGHLTVITSWEKVPVCVIEVISVEIRPFNEVDAAFAFEEGEGDKSLEYWKSAHLKFFKEELKEINRSFSEDMPVVLIRFKKVYP